MGDHNWEREATRNIVREQNPVDLWNICECGAILHSIVEGKRGSCGRCWIKSMPSDTKSAMNRLIAAAFNPTTESEKGELVNDALEKLRRDDRCGEKP